MLAAERLQQLAEWQDQLLPLHQQLVMVSAYGRGLLGKLEVAEVQTRALQEPQLHGAAVEFHALEEAEVAELQWRTQILLAELLPVLG